MSKYDNIYDLVERTAATPRCEFPRLELWEDAARALIKGRLRATNLSDRPAPHSSTMNLRGWLRQFQEALARGGSDPSSFKPILRSIIVRTADFDKWLQGARSKRRGPLPKTTGYQAAARSLFPRIFELISTGQARSAHGAALQLVRSGKVEKKNADEKSIAKRISALYRKEHPTGNH
jgi:hypothetical protein